MSTISLDINAAVKRQYETYPYPDYSLFIPLRAQEAYASHAAFCAQLAHERGSSTPAPGKTLIAGSGDVLPYILSFWENETAEIYAADLSERNLQRARFRSLLRPQAFHWLAGNLEDRAFELPKELTHIDSYGVLHHLANPKATVERLGHLLAPGGTMRIMVYNSDVRAWIHHLQKAFALLGLSPYVRSDLDQAVTILKQLMTISPFFSERMGPMRASILHHSARFVDTFFHAREAKLSLDYWLDALDAGGFSTLGLLDRYAELDDLANPLWEFPRAADLSARIADRRFENNFEIYVQRRGAPPARIDAPTRFSKAWRLKTPPKAWFTYSETNRLPFATRFKLWHNYLRTLEGQKTAFDAVAGKLDTQALQRLARIGAIFPSSVQSEELKTVMRAPIHQTMDRPTFASAVDIRSNATLRSLLERTLRRQRRGHRNVLEQVYKRLEASQKP